MAHIVLIACTAQKAKRRSRARDLYTSALFRKSLAFADDAHADAIYVLSAKHGLVSIDDWIEPYDITLHGRPREAVQAWADRVIRELGEVADLELDRFTILAGSQYRRFLVPRLANVAVPLAGLRIGQQLKALTAASAGHVGEASPCALAHRLLRAQRCHSFPFATSEIPPNGLYVLFEKGEEAHGAPRIVRIGTHTGEKQLASRLTQHFVKENKDRSIFRKNVGRCILARSNDPYLPAWEMDRTSQARRARATSISFDAARQAAIESSVSSRIRSHFGFTTIPVDTRQERLRLEAGLISLVSLCPECRPSSRWLGLHSPKQRIRESGLWQVNELYKEPLSRVEVETLRAAMDESLALPSRITRHLTRPLPRRAAARPLPAGS